MLFASDLDPHLPKINGTLCDLSREVMRQSRHASGPILAPKGHCPPASEVVFST